MFFTFYFHLLYFCLYSFLKTGKQEWFGELFTILENPIMLRIRYGHEPTHELKFIIITNFGWFIVSKVKFIEGQCK